MGIREKLDAARKRTEEKIEQDQTKRQEPLDRARELGYTFEVTDNIATAGLGTTTGIKYRWTVYDKDKTPVKAGYAVTIGDGRRRGEMQLRKIGKKHL